MSVLEGPRSKLPPVNHPPASGREVINRRLIQVSGGWQNDDGLWRVKSSDTRRDGCRQTSQTIRYGQVRTELTSQLAGQASLIRQIIRCCANLCYQHYNSLKKRQQIVDISGMNDLQASCPKLFEVAGSPSERVIQL